MPTVPVRAHPANVAIPDDALTGLVVQARAPEPLATDRMIGALEVVTVLPLASWTVSTGWAARATALATVVLGWVVTASFDATPAVRAKLDVVALVRPVDDAVRVKFPTVPVSLQPAKVAMPAVAATGLVVQAKVPVPLATAKVTAALDPVAVLPLVSWTVTIGWVVNAAPLTAPDGWVVTISLVAAPAVTLMDVEVAPVKAGTPPAAPKV